MSLPSFLCSLLLMLGILACQQAPPPPDLFAGAQTVVLTGEGVSLKLPVYFVRSSPERFTEEMTYLKGDTSFFNSVAVFLDGFGFRDKTLDVLVDTTSAFRCLMIAEGPKFRLDEATGKMLNKELGDYFRQVDEENLFLDIHKIDSKLKKNDQIDLLKYKYEIVHTMNRASYYQSIFFLSNLSRSLLIMEFSLDGNDIEDYLWTVRGN